MLFRFVESHGFKIRYTNSQVSLISILNDQLENEFKVDTTALVIRGAKQNIQMEGGLQNVLG
jgi:hypothetical protein